MDDLDLQNGAGPGPDDLDLIGCPVFATPAGSTDRQLSNLKQYATGHAKRGYRPGPGYIGQFPNHVRDIIKGLVSGRVLHLYSGTSDIGEVRIDLSRPEATHNINVEEFITSDTSSWDWCILDPPYRLIQTAILKEYQDGRPLSGNALLRDRLCLYFQLHVNNVLWLDYCCPTIRGFKRQAIWLLLPGRTFENVRVLTWLIKEQSFLPLDSKERGLKMDLEQAKEILSDAGDRHCVTTGVDFYEACRLGKEAIILAEVEHPGLRDAMYPMTEMQVLRSRYHADPRD